MGARAPHGAVLSLNVWTTHRQGKPPVALVPVRVEDGEPATIKESDAYLPLANPAQSASVKTMFLYVALRKGKAWRPGPYEGVELVILDKQVRHDPHVRVIKSSVSLCLTGR